MPSKEEKIKAFLNGDFRRIEFEYINEKGEGAIGDFWNDVSFDEIKSSADKYGISENFCNREPGTGDGTYIVESGKEWKVYYQERGIIMREKAYSNYQDAVIGALALVAGDCGIIGAKKYLDGSKN